MSHPVVICFQISIFEPLETTFLATILFNKFVVICFQISIFEPLETTKLGLWTIGVQL